MLDAALAVVDRFERRSGGCRRFLACWIPEDQLLVAILRCMEAHGSPERWWDGLDSYLA